MGTDQASAFAVEQHAAALAYERDHAREQIAGMRQELSRHEETLAEYRRSAIGELEPDEAEPVKITAVIERLRQERDRAREEAAAWRALQDGARCRIWTCRDGLAGADRPREGPREAPRPRIRS